MRRDGVMKLRMVSVTVTVVVVMEVVGDSRTVTRTVRLMNVMKDAEDRQ